MYLFFLIKKFTPSKVTYNEKAVQRSQKKSIQLFIFVIVLQALM